MATKKYVVREGFNFPVKIEDDKGNVKIKVYDAGDTVNLDSSIGDVSHQLEYADEADRATALKAEQKAAKDAKAAQAAETGAIDHEALAATVATAVAQALAAAGVAKVAS